MAYVIAGEKLFLEGTVSGLAEAEQREAMEADDREGLVREYLEQLLPADWDTMDLSERRGFLRGDAFIGGDRTGTVKRQSVCALEVWCECFGREASSIRRSDTNEIFSLFIRIGGWERSKENSAGCRRLPIYGVQRCFDRAPQK